MFNVERIKEIVTGPIEPNVPNTLWIDTTNPESPVLKVVVNGAYRAMAGSSSGGDDSDKCLCDIVTVEINKDDYTSSEDHSLLIFSEELNSKVWEYLEDGKCILLKGSDELPEGVNTSYTLLNRVKKILPTAPIHVLDFGVVYSIGNVEVEFFCCAPENYQALKDYRHPAT